MTFNLSNEVIFKEDKLDKEIKKSLMNTKKIILKYYKTNEKEVEIDFKAATFKSSKDLIHIKNAIIADKMIKNLLTQGLGKVFIKEAFLLNQTVKKEQCIIETKNFHKKYNLKFEYSTSYHTAYIQVLSLLLLHLHFEKIIHLPFKFKIPYNLITNKNGKKKRLDLGIDIYPEMFKVIRLLDSQNMDDEESKYLTQDHKEILISYGSKLFISLGWNNFSDVNTEELLNFKQASQKENLFNSRPPYKLLITLLNNRFPKDFNINNAEWWKLTLETNKNEKNIVKTKKILNTLKSNKSNQEFGELGLDLFDFKNLNNLKQQLPIYIDSINYWQNIEKNYLKKVKLENYKTLYNAFKHLNMYLFLILPNWYKYNNSKYTYPIEPKDFKSGIFFSRLIETNDIMPPTFMNFLKEKQEKSQTSNEYLYSLLKHISKLFDFIVTYSEELDGCLNFINPISDFDFPKIKKSQGTNKGLIPRYLFGFLISYIEMLQVYNKVVLEKILENKLNYNDVKESFVDSKGEVINTKKIQEKVGFIPMLYWNNNKVVFEEIPNLIDFQTVRLKDDRILKIPSPHTLNHIYIALQTGLRGNNIQWLDAEKFDCMIKEEENNFLPLYVNTDKSKTNAWIPIVHKKVIETLRRQLKWRNLINNTNFNEKKFYNNNPNSKWGNFYPIFSYSSDGLPYNDTQYSNCWLSVIVNFQTIIEKFGLKPMKLAKLLPPGISINEFNMDIKLKEYGQKCKNKCELRWTSEITPHSARVSVVSHHITALPSEVIGQYITGQNEAVVHHYVKLDPQYLTELENGQKDRLNQMLIEKKFNILTGQDKLHSLLTDKENSNLSKSIKISRQETISQYGCISINIKEDGKNGLDILLEESNTQLAYNKTEICPYNNQCPNDLIKELKGFRRCGICPYAVRSIDHLPAIAIKKRQMLELMEEIEIKLGEAIEDELNVSYSVEDIDSLEDEKQRITEELIGWIVSEEMLEANRKIIQENGDLPIYMVKKPEILIENLQQVSKKENDIEYLLTRLGDCKSFPTLESPLIRAKFDLLRRQLLAKTGDFIKAFDSKLPANPAYECLGLLKSVIERHGLSQEQVIGLLSTNMLILPNQNTNKPLLELGYGKED